MFTDVLNNDLNSIEIGDTTIPSDGDSEVDDAAEEDLNDIVAKTIENIEVERNIDQETEIVSWPEDNSRKIENIMFTILTLPRIIFL